LPASEIVVVEHAWKLINRLRSWTYEDVEQGGGGDRAVAVPVGVSQDGADERQQEADAVPGDDALGRRRRAHPHHAGEVRHQVRPHPLVREPLHARHGCHIDHNVTDQQAGSSRTTLLYFKQVALLITYDQNAWPAQRRLRRRRLLRHARSSRRRGEPDVVTLATRRSAYSCGNHVLIAPARSDGPPSRRRQ